MISELVIAPRRRDSDIQKYCKAVLKTSDKNSKVIIGPVIKTC